MKSYISAIGLALASLAALSPASLALAQNSSAQTQSAERDAPSPARQAVEWSQNRLAELDATIALLEEKATGLQSDAFAKAEEALKVLRARRDAYQAQAEDAFANAESWTDAQIEQARQSLDESWTAFLADRDAYLDAAKVDLETRRDILEAELEARRNAWRQSLEELRAEAAGLAKDQRAAIDARIAELGAEMDKAGDGVKARIDRLQIASTEAKETLQQSYADAQELFLKTYVSIRKSIREGSE
ncbi:hypothetical protein [Salipiger thiooxidans]|jgi:uncharacterized phage infection (PIP) family protein YhgE|uniref:hypothetical protein n=1 Tax=Salipiger thiooxidans TaxID=282683 RepID=UPI001CFC0D73|nr:hypothetical protein [Salipiger thiooxidans]|tara:strand:- start:2815 stop:3552 length:738 start_codon:yes stop_codon:yes gene_type:complete